MKKSCFTITLNLKKPTKIKSKVNKVFVNILLIMKTKIK
jgi:hypothetical protein